jgi:hypothetical protein
MAHHLSSHKPLSGRWANTRYGRFTPARTIYLIDPEGREVGQVHSMEAAMRWALEWKGASFKEGAKREGAAWVSPLDGGQS